VDKKPLLFFASFFCVFFILVILLSIGYTQEKLIIHKEGDIQVTSNPKHPIPKDGIKKRIVFEEDLSIGIVEGDENYMFSGTICFNTDADGNFYVSDVEALRIQKYSPQGKYLLTIGRKGQGPGEFQSLSVVRFDQDGHPYIGDVTGRKISFFRKDGEFLKQISMPRGYENLYINSQGLMVANKYEQIPSDNAMTFISTLELFDEEFTTLAELQKIKREIAIPGRDPSAIAQSMANMINLMVFKPQEFLTLTRDDFIYTGYPEKYEINVFSPEGKLVKKITRDYEPVPVNKEDKKTFEEEMSQGETFKNAPEDFRKKVFQLIEYPKHKPAYMGFTLVQSGLNQSFCLMENGWLALIADVKKDKYAIFDLFDQEGRYIANFKTTVPVEGLFFNSGKAYAVATEDGYKFVKRYRIKLQEYKNNKWVDSRLILKQQE